MGQPGQVLAEAGPDVADVVGVDQLEHVLADPGVLAVAEHAPEGRAGVGDAAAGVEHDHHVRGVLDQRPEAGRRVPQGLLGPLQLQLLGDVAGGEDEPARPAVGRRDPGPGAVQPAGLAVGPQHLDHRRQRGLLVGPAVQLDLAPGHVPGPQPGQAAGADHVGRPVAGDLLEPRVPAGHGAVRVEGGDAVGGVLDDLRQLGPLLQDRLEQLALLDGRPHLGGQGVQDGQLALLEALEAGAVVGAQHPDDLALDPHRGGQAVPPALVAQPLGELAGRRRASPTLTALPARIRAAASVSRPASSTRCSWPGSCSRLRWTTRLPSRTMTSSATSDSKQRRTSARNSGTASRGFMGTARAWVASCMPASRARSARTLRVGPVGPVEHGQGDQEERHRLGRPGGGGDDRSPRRRG